MDVAAVMPTLNEAERIEDSLESVQWCDEIFVVDSQSTDRTRDIAREHGAEIVDAPRTGTGEPFDHLRNLGIKKASSDLILFIDADEKFPVSLQERLQEIADQPPEDVGVVRAPIMEFLGDTALTGGDLDYSPILFYREAVTIQERVHSFMDYDETDVQDLPQQPEFAVHHQLAPSVSEHWRDQRRYAKIAGANRDFNPLKLLLAPPWGFYHRTIENQRWRDGFLGIAIGLCYSWFLFEANLRAIRS